MQLPIYVTSNNTVIRKSGNHLIIDKDKKIPCPAQNISYIIKYGNSKVSEQVINFLAINNIPIFRFTYGGKFCGMFIPPENNIGKIRLKQYEHYFDNNKRMKIAKLFISGSTQNKITILKKYNYRLKSNELKKIIEQIKILLSELDKVKNIEELRGKEGIITKYYYDGLRKVINSKYVFGERIYHPPKDEINCLLSFGYSLLYCEIYSKLMEHGFDCFLGYIHEQNDDQHPLVYDISELYRNRIDSFLLSFVNNNQLKDFFFNKKPDGSCLLSTIGKNFILKEWNKLLVETSFDKDIDYLRSFQELIRKEVLKLKHYLVDGGEYVCYKV